MDEFKKSFEASKIFQMLQRGKDDLLKGLSKDMVHALLIGSLERLFELLGQHELEITLRIKKREPLKENKEGQTEHEEHKAPSSSLKRRFHSNIKKNSP